MLTIGKLGASAGQLDYYERQVAAGAEDYYAGRGDSPGTWMGGGLDTIQALAGTGKTTMMRRLADLKGHVPGWTWADFLW